MIEASFAMQYPQKDLYDEIMDWKEFTTLLSGIMPETPLGKIISIRSESDGDILERFTPEQHRIRNEWNNRQFQKKIESMSKEEVMKQVQAMFRSMAA